MEGGGRNSQSQAQFLQTVEKGGTKTSPKRTALLTVWRWRGTGGAEFQRSRPGHYWRFESRGVGQNFSVAGLVITDGLKVGGAGEWNHSHRILLYFRFEKRGNGAFVWEWRGESFTKTNCFTVLCKEPFFLRFFWRFFSFSWDIFVSMCRMVLNFSLMERTKSGRCFQYLKHAHRRVFRSSTKQKSRKLPRKGVKLPKVGGPPCSRSNF